MAYAISRYEAEKQELSCINVIPILKYLEKLYGSEKLIKIVEPIGLPLSFLNDKKNWISYKHYNELLKKLVEVTGDEEAPFKAPFTTKPQEVFDYVLFTTYKTFFSGSPKMVYKIALSLYKRWGKIGVFKILSSKRNYITVELTLNKGYKQTVYNCKAIKGMLASAPIGMGLPPSQIEEHQCAALGAASCIYTIKWQRKRNWFFIISFPIFIVTLFLEMFIFTSFFTVKDIIITIFVYLLSHLIVRNFLFWKDKHMEEEVKDKQNKYMLDALEKIEKDYKELLDTKLKLEERTKYLSIINKVSEKITNATDFTILLEDVIIVLKDNLNFLTAKIFQYRSEDKQFHSMADNEILISKKEYQDLKQRGSQFSLDNLKASSAIYKWAEQQTAEQIFIIPISVSNIYSAFICFLSKYFLPFSKALISSLFNNITSQLNLGYQKISSRHAIENILSSIPAFVVIFNITSMKIRYINDLFISSFPKISNKYTKEQIIGNDLMSILPFDKSTKKNIQKNIKLIARGRESDKFETNFGPIVIEHYLFPIPQNKEEEQLVGIIMRDITEAHYFQQKLLINEKLLALGRVASGIAHEINNPLYAVLANSEDIAEDSTISQQSREYAEEIIEHVMHVSHIIQDLSAYSKTLRKEKYDMIDINNVIEESLKLVKYSSNFLEVEIKKDFANLPHIQAAKGEMQQVFINIFSNAIQAMNGRGTLKISTRKNDHKIRVMVTDTGKGIPPDVLPQIFDLYFTTKKESEGTGQGLHIAKKILTNYNGDINVQSKVGQGTTITIDFRVRK